jgi:glycosyltransferase involved in cell wall biosynthesis
MASMKLLFISTNSEWGGSENLWSMAARKAFDEGHQIRIIAHPDILSKPIIANLGEAGADLQTWPDHGYSKRSILDKIAYRVGLAKTKKPRPVWDVLLDEDEDTICISQGTWDEALTYPDLCAALLKSDKPITLLARSDSSRGSLSDSQRQLGRELYARSSAYVSACRSTVEVVELGLAFKIKNVHIIHSPIRSTGITTASTQHAPPYVLACVGRLLCSNKGQHLLLKVLAGDHWRDRNWVLFLYGEGPDKNYLNELILYYNLQDRVFLKGYESSLEVIWNKCDILIQPSIIEGVPQSMLEAMSFGKPIVATAISGIPEWIEDGVSGFLAKSATSKDIDQALDCAWSQRHDWLAIGEQARSTFLEKKNANPVASLLDILCSVATPFGQTAFSQQ